MIDIHSHILPSVDDGARDMDEALRLLELAIADGVTTQVLTPHQNGRYDEESWQVIRSTFTRFGKAAHDSGLEARLILAAEVMISFEILNLVKSDRMPWIGAWNGRKAFLMDIPINNMPFGGENLAKRLAQENVQPIMAHPERNRDICKDVSKIEPYLAAGCLLQINSGSLMGSFGRPPYETAIELLKLGYVTFIATDCHNLGERYPNLKEGAKITAEIVGEEEADRMVSGAPEKLLEGLKTLA